VSAAYDFTKPGAGDYTIEPSNLFTYVDADGTPKNIYATVDETAKVKLSGTLSFPRAHRKRATFNGCTPEQQLEIESAIPYAHNYSVESYTYLSAISGPTTRYTAWFGEYEEGRKSTVQEHFNLIGSTDLSTFSYDCTCTTVDTFAYVYPDEFGMIYLCGAFWTAPTAGASSKAGTFVHESSHYTVNGATEDHVYGYDPCLALAISSPANATSNADNHEYFAENDPHMD
jgi:peptidyl-Lys metalloendopeptidase